MTLPASGPIKISEILEEFEKSTLDRILNGNPNSENISLGSFRRAETIASNTYPISDGVPTSGTIKFSDFYNAKKTIIVGYARTFVSQTGRTLSQDYLSRNNNPTLVSAGFTAYKISPNPLERGIGLPNFDNKVEAKVIIYIQGLLGSRNISTSHCALHIDSEFNILNSGSNIIVETAIGSTISGGGGRGGQGGSRGVSLDGNLAGIGGSGGHGGSAIGISTPISIIYNRGRIQSGMGGGGGGGAQVQNNNSAGGGGGGGSGFPIGLGGTGGGNAQPGVAGTILSGGRGGAGAASGTRIGGSGGIGGTTFPSLFPATAGSTSTGGQVGDQRAGGFAGVSGNKLVISSGITTPTIVSLGGVDIGNSLTNTTPTI